MSIFGVVLIHVFLALFPIRTEYEEILHISPYSVQMRKNVGRMQTSVTPNTDTFYAVMLSLECHEDSRKLQVENGMLNKIQIVHGQNLLNYVSYVPSCPVVTYVLLYLTCFVPCVLLFATHFVSYVLSCLTCLMLYVLLYFTCVCRLVPCTFWAFFS